MTDPHDVLGRWFVDHPHLRLGFLWPTDGLGSAAHYDFARFDDTVILRGHDLAPAHSRRSGLLRFSISLVGRSGDDATRTGTSLSMAWDAAQGRIGYRAVVPHALKLAIDPLRTVRLIRRGAGAGAVHNTAHGGWSDPATRLHEVSVLGVESMFEQRPSPDNRVRLDRERSPLGQRRPVLQWAWSARERASVTTSVELLRQSIEDAGIGRFRSVGDLGGGAVPRGSTGFHQMGGTRMAVEPGDGVVDPDCRVHGTDNLYVAGSSVFPSSAGFANPTLTLVALALRLGDHLGDLAPTAPVGRARSTGADTGI